MTPSAEADAVETAIATAIAGGARTADIAAGGEYLTTDEMTAEVMRKLT